MSDGLDALFEEYKLTGGLPADYRQLAVRAHAIGVSEATRSIAAIYLPMATKQSDRVIELEIELRELRNALAVYACKANYVPTHDDEAGCAITEDAGETARIALGVTP